MTYAAQSRFRSFSLVVGLGLLAITAQAGAPGLDVTNGSFHISPPSLQSATGPVLSPAEIRNGVSVRMDTLAAQGITIDRASVDGIGLENMAKRLAAAPTR